MDVDKHKRHALLSWLFVGVMVALTVILAVLQYRWIGEVSLAEHDRLRAGLHTSLQKLSLDFNSEITAACAALLPVPADGEEAETDEAYALRYARWRESSQHNGLFRRVALIRPEGETAVLRNLDLDKATFVDGEWPAEWSGLHDRLAARLSGEPGPRGPLVEEEAALIELPRFGRADMFRGGPRRGLGPPAGQQRNRPEMGWLVVELNLDYLRSYLLPELVQRHLGDSGKREYQVEVVTRDGPGRVIYASEPGGASPIGAHSDASIGIFEVQFEMVMRRVMGFRGREGWRQGRMRPEFAGPPERGRWLLAARHRAGSLEAVVNQLRLRNLGVVTAILVLILAAMAALLQFTRRAQKLAEVQMEFVAGVSHELRTPLSVIRTAGHNLGGGVVSSGKQVQRYGTLIADEAERLTSIVEQVLRFANAKVGRAISAREPAAVQSLIDDALRATSKILEESRCTVEMHVDPKLPPVLADPVALKHALQNLLTNAAKYGMEGGWIGVFATAPVDAKEPVVEIRVADHGQGIPREELAQIFDPFYRGKRALEDQIHGTGLGLSLVKRIIEAHDGTVAVDSEPGKGTQFVLRIPAAPAEQVDEFADTARRG